MNKPKFETPDMVEKNIEKLAELFPNCVTETRGEDGKLKKAVNFEMLQQILSTEFPPEGAQERYEFTWVGKRAAIAEANKPIRKTLRPCKAESKNWDKTENLYIEGDNLEVLKLLQESYLGKVKMIYIDPPYNTGNDFIYRDDFKQTQEEYNKKVNEAKGVLLAAADAAKVGGSEVERLRAEYIAFNRVQNANKSTSGTGKLQDDAIKSIQQLKQAMTKAELDLEQSRISIMQEGGDKELAQLRLNHQKRMAEIEKQTQDIINKAREAEKAEWMKENPARKESDFTSKIVGVNDLPSEFQQTIQ